jgi:hypothetical protein
VVDENFTNAIFEAMKLEWVPLKDYDDLKHLRKAIHNQRFRDGE